MENGSTSEELIVQKLVKLGVNSDDAKEAAVTIIGDNRFPSGISDELLPELAQRLKSAREVYSRIKRRDAEDQNYGAKEFKNLIQEIKHGREEPKPQKDSTMNKGVRIGIVLTVVWGILTFLIEPMENPRWQWEDVFLIMLTLWVLPSVVAWGIYWINKAPKQTNRGGDDQPPRG